MNYNINRINKIEIENKIWIIYFIIIGLSYYANHCEKKYFIYNNIVCKEKYRRIQFFIFSLLFVIYCYFENDAIESCNNTNESRKEYNILVLIASSFILISGFIFLYIIANDKDIEEEIAFN